MSRTKFLVVSALYLTLGNGHANAQSQTFIDIAKGGNQICGITTANELLCTENSAASRLEPPANTPALFQVGVGDVHACGLDMNGTAICWGDNDYGQLDVPMDKTFSSIDVGWNHTCAVTADFETLCWGLSSNDRLNVPTDGLPFVEVDASLTHSCALEAAGGIRCWGADNFRWDPQTASADIIAFASTASLDQPALCAIIFGGSVECTSSFHNFVGTYTDIAALGRGMCALNTDGDIECQSIPNELEQEIATLNQGPAFEKITSHHALCAVDVVGNIGCTSTASTASTGPAQRALNDVPLPGQALDNGGFAVPDSVDDLSVIIYSASTVELFWSSIRKAGDGRIAGAEIYRDGELLLVTDNANSYLDRTLSAGINYDYEVRIINTRGDVGPAGNVVIVNTDDLLTQVPNYTPPFRSTTPQNAAVFDNPENNEVEILWDQPADPRDRLTVYGYEIYRNNEYIGFTQDYSFIDKNRIIIDFDHYMIVAVDKDGAILGAATSSVAF